MKPAELSHGEQVTLALRPSFQVHQKHLPKPKTEVVLRFLVGDGRCHLSSSSGRLEVEGTDKENQGLLEGLRQTDPPRISWVTHVDSKEQVVVVQVHRFHRLIRPQAALDIGVDDQVVERVTKLVKRALDTTQVCGWLSSQILLPPSLGSKTPRVIATGDPEGAHFRLLGERVAIDIDSHNQVLTVARVLGLPRRNQGFRPPEFLLELEVAFTDITITGKARNIIRDQLKALLQASDQSYFMRWQTYQELERRQLLERARRVGFLHYHSYQMKPSGNMHFRSKQPEDFKAFVAGLLQEQEQLEAASDLPMELVQDLPEGGSDTDSRPGPKGFVGTVEDVIWGKKTVILKPVDELHHFTAPPKQGFLFCSLTGDRVRLARREDAAQRLKAADARLPQLALIIEGQPAPMRRSDKVKPLSQNTRTHFRAQPTPKQRQAIDVALNTPDIALIQGPPGTGKTTVIAAVQARLAELEAKGREPFGQILLSSYQHDAVDNAVERTRVLGLPPSRFGGKSGNSSALAQAERFAAGLHTQVKARLASWGDDRPLTRHRHTCIQVAHVAAGDTSQTDVLALLQRLLEWPAETLPLQLVERIQAVKTKLERQQEPAVGVLLALKAIRSLRTTHTAFADDGPARARRVLVQLSDRLMEAEESLLSEAGQHPLDLPFERLDALATLQRTLLERYAEPTLPNEAPALDPEVLDTLKAVLQHLKRSIERSPSGVGDALEELAETLVQAPKAVMRCLRHYSVVYAATCQQSVGRAIRNQKDFETAFDSQSAAFAFSTVIVDEAARANPLDLFIPISVAKRRVILVGDHRQLPHLLEPSVERALEEDPESLIAQALKESLFEKLFEELNGRAEADGVTRVVTLDQQFRMHPVLGTFVSETFYDDFGEAFQSPRPATDFEHKISHWTRGERPVCAGWKDIPLTEGHEKSIGRSWGRSAEAHWIADHVNALVRGDAHGLTVGVISFYRAQVTQILEAMLEFDLTARDGDTGALEIAKDWRDLEYPDGSRVERLRVGTVDAFQGMEFDVVILSTVRANGHLADGPEGQRRKYGHLLLPNRLCVAMSRQKCLLVVVGDGAMYAGDEGKTSVPALHKFRQLCGSDDGLLA